MIDPDSGGGSEPYLEVAGVSKTYPGGARALDGVDLAIHRGETVALVGESGSGKTTLLRLFNRMAEATAGETRVAGRDVREWDAVDLRRRLGYVQQEGGLIPHWTVERNVALVPELLGWDAETRDRRVRETLALVRLDAERYAARYPIQLSGGERQRAALARALAADPEAVLLDEPLGALDALTRLELQRQLLELKKSLGKTLVLVTHDLGEAWALADRIAVLRRGRLIQIATPAELESDPVDSYISDLLRLRPLTRADLSDAR